MMPLGRLMPGANLLSLVGRCSNGQARFFRRLARACSTSTTSDVAPAISLHS